MMHGACRNVLAAIVWFAATEVPSAHADADDAATPPFVAALIGKYAAVAPANPPVTITRFRYRGQDVWYVPPRCCDIPGRLFDANGAVLCAPDGGITGHGDGRCRDFGKERTGGTIVWKDSALRR